jgi:Leucine-rich repeat (LRR) protein
LAEYADQWLAPLREYGAQGLSARCLQRGLIERVRIDAAAFLRHGADLCRETPALYCLELRGRPEEFNALTSAPLPDQVSSLDLRSNRLTQAALAQLARAVWRGQIQELSLALNQLDNPSLAALAAGDWPALTRLNLNANRLGPEGMAEFARRPAMPRLESLSLNANPIRDSGLTHLANSYLVHSLRELDIGATGVKTGGVQFLAESPLGQKLESLVLRGNSLGDVSRLLGAFAGAANLRHLDLRGTHSHSTRSGYGTVPQVVAPALRERLGDGLLW